MGLGVDLGQWVNRMWCDWAADKMGLGTGDSCWLVRVLGNRAKGRAGWCQMDGDVLNHKGIRGYQRVGWGGVGLGGFRTIIGVQV